MMLRKILTLLLLVSLALAPAGILVTPVHAQFAGQATGPFVGGGTANAQVVTIPNVASLNDLLGVQFSYTPIAPNTSAATLTVNLVGGGSLTPTAIKKQSPNGPSLAALTGQELGPTVVMMYDGTEFVLMTNYVLSLLNPLQSNLTLYVSGAGSDTNNSCQVSGTPCATLQHAWNVLVSQFNLNGYSVTIQLADGTYTGGLLASTMPIGILSTTSIIVNGDSGTPSNVLISTTSANCVSAYGPTGFVVQNMKLTSSTGNLLLASNGGSISFQNMVFGSTSANHVAAQASGSIVAIGNYSVVGGAVADLSSTVGGTININGVTVTHSGTPAYSQGFAAAAALGSISAVSVTFTGAASGSRYSINGNGVVFTNGAGSTYLPGSTGGSTSTGGQYY